MYISADLQLMGIGISDLFGYSNLHISADLQFMRIGISDLFGYSNR
jgi:hypothetical protein